MQLFHILKELALEQGIQPTRGLEHYNLDAIMAVSYVVLGREVGRHRNPSPPRRGGMAVACRFPAEGTQPADLTDNNTLPPRWGLFHARGRLLDHKLRRLTPVAHQTRTNRYRLHEKEEEVTMGYDIALTTTLTGATVAQLQGWRRNGLLVPETSSSRPIEYSFRDLVALRTIARLRAHTSLQQIRKAFNTLSEFDMVDHPSEYRFATDGKTVKVWTDAGFMDLNEGSKGQFEFYTLADIYESFTNMNDKLVPDFRHPKPRLSVNPRRMGGYPTIRGSRVPYLDVAELYKSGELEPGEIEEFYPQVSDEDARDALDFHTMVMENAA